VLGTSRIPENQNLIKKKQSKKDSGLESGDVSDSCEFGKKKRASSFFFSIYTCFINKGVGKDLLYTKVPDYLSIVPIDTTKNVEADNR